MNDLLSTSVVILAELTLMFGAAIVIFFVLRARRLKRERAMVTALIARLREQEPARKQQLLHMLTESCGLDESRSEEMMDALNGSEKILYSKMIRMFLGRERDNIKNLDRDVKSLVQSYVNLIQGEAESEHDGASGTSVLSFTAIRKENENLKDQTDQLKEEITRLRTELTDANSTVEGMMKEYATMFAGGQREGEMQIRDEMDKLKERDWANATQEDASPDAAQEKPAGVIDDNGDVPEFGTQVDQDDPDKQAS